MGGMRIVGGDVGGCGGRGERIALYDMVDEIPTPLLICLVPGDTESD